MQETVAPPGRGRRTFGFVAIGVVVIVAVAIVVAVAFRNTVALAGVQSVARRFGYAVELGSLDVNLARARAHGIRVRNAAGEPVLEARDLEITYSLRDLLPGGKRLLGLESVILTAPHVTVIHHTDGTYNITVPQTSAGAAPQHPPPLDLRLRVRDGSVDLVDRFVTAPRERRARLVAIGAEGVISPAAGSYYHAGASFEDGGRRYPIVGNARFEDPRGFELQHWTAAKLPIATLANFAVSSHALRVEAGEIRRLDVKVGALATAAGEMQLHLGATGELAGGRIATTALAKPIRDARGTFVIDDDSATVRSLDAAVSGIPLHVSGALYHFAQPQIAFALTARGDLAAARGLSKDTATLPIAGAVAVQGLAEGPIASPLVFARFALPHATYGAYRLDGPRGFVAVSGSELDVIEARTGYGPAELAGRGSLLLAAHTRTSGYATLQTPADGLPYVANLVPGMNLGGTVVVTGTDAKLSARGYLGGVNGSDRLDVPFAIAADRSGDVGPIVLQRRDGASVYARAVIDRGGKQTVALADIRALSLLPAASPTLPGLVLPALPPRIDAKLDATLTGIASGSTLASAGGFLHAYGSWGDLRAQADGGAAQLAARGRLTSSFERLAPFTGKLDAHGGIDVPFALASGGRSTIVQIEEARFSDASVHGITLQGANATLGVGSRAIDIYAADLRIAGRDVTATGSFGNGGRVHVTAGDLDLAALRSAGVAIPIAGGHATVIADVGGSYAKPTATVLGALGGARYADADIGGDVGLAYDGEVLRIDRATLAYGSAYAAATGAVAGLALGHIAPRYDVRARLEDADIATLAHTVKNPLRYPAGTLDADVRVRGSGSKPSVMGDVRIPEGSLNGLNFRAAHIGLDGNLAGVRADAGRITVGTTTVTFAGSASRTHQSASVRSERIDLADFNDYFNEAEVLAGTGNAAAAFDATPQALYASIDLALRDTRYRRFDLGSVHATAHTIAGAVSVDAGIDGTNGRVSLTGNVTLPATQPLHDLIRRSDVDLQTQIAGIDLGNVLPAAGFNVPLLGIVDGSAAIRGHYPALALSTHVALTRGVAGRVPIDRFTVAASAAGGRGRLTDLTLVTPGLSANVTGTFGLRPEDAFDLRAQAASTNLNDLVTSVTGKSADVKGSLVTTARVTGTIARPTLSGAIDGTNLTYAAVTIPSVHAELAATRASADVRNGTIALPRGGSITFDAHAPLSRGSSTSTPIALDFAPHRVDVNPYSPLLPDGSVVRGIFDGNVGVRGTLDAPKLSGRLAFTDGSFRSNTLPDGLSAIELELDFSGTAVQIAKLHAHAAPGDIDGTGRLALRDLRDPIRGLTTNVNLTLANARIGAPKYYVGAVDGTITARKRVASPLTVGGDLTFSSARIPYTALLPSGGAAKGPAPVLPDVAFNLGVNLGRDVRVQSGPVDIGAVGKAQLGGTLAKPTLGGEFTATNGTVSLYRTFTVQNGSAVSFNPSDGITPSVDATAVTNVPDPPTDVLLRITGLSTQLHLAFSSEPAYSQQQILGLLVGAQNLGAVSGVAATSGSGTNGVSVAGLGEGVLNTQLTQKFLQPFTSKLGGALGLSDLNVNYSLNGSVSATAMRRIGKNISFTYGEQIGGPAPRTSVGIRVGGAITSAQLTFYQAAGGSQAFGGQALTPFLQSGFLATSPPNYTLEAIEPPSGSGFVFSYQRHFW